jgi:predicted transposase/invertase (TIGR01784 family)
MQINKLTDREMEEYKTSIFEYDSIREAIAYSEQRAMEKGWQEGRQEGRQETRLETAQRCLQQGLSIEFITSITGLDIEQIKNMSGTLESADK